MFGAYTSNNIPHQHILTNAHKIAKLHEPIKECYKRLTTLLPREWNISIESFPHAQSAILK